MYFKNNKISRAFSNAAFKYDESTSLHRNIGESLVKKIENIKDVNSSVIILDVGMGTGYMTERVRTVFTDSKIVGIDFALGMLDFVKRKRKDIFIVGADAARLPFRENIFDVIVSNLVYQWVENLGEAFRQCRMCLKEKNKGGFYFSMFGKGTFKELFLSLENSMKDQSKRDSFPAQKLADRSDIVDALETAGFRNQKVETKSIKIRFDDMFDLIKWIKNIGANSLKREIFVGKEFLNRANDYYLKNFCDDTGVFATMEIVQGEASR